MNMSSADHTLNTLRYADRVKEKKVDNEGWAKSPRQQVSIRKINNNTRNNKSQSRSPLRSRSPNTSKSPDPITRSNDYSLRSNKKLGTFVMEDAQDDIDYLHASLRGNSDESKVKEESKDVAELHRTVQNLFEEEENLLNLHMSFIQVSLLCRPFISYYYFAIYSKLHHF